MELGGVVDVSMEADAGGVSADTTYYLMIDDIERLIPKLQGVVARYKARFPRKTMRIWKTGEPCKIKVGGKTIVGRIELASPNGKSLFLTWEDGAILVSGGTYVNSMPVTADEDGDFQDLITGTVIELEPA